jgi:3-isopropylmalate/(R)-2-methylmalate dehydratase small subunit
MQPFTRLSGRAIPLPEENIDTDIIFPARFLLVMEKQGLGRYLFYDRRFTAAGAAREQCVFDDSQYSDAPILIAGANFGCGSSREQAVWALAGFGIRCVIAPSFGEIFHSNCFKSGVLPIVLSQSLILDLVKRSLGGAIFDIDLNSQTIATSDGLVLSFTVEADRRAALLDGMDEIDMILRDELQAIESFEAVHDLAQPWLRTAVGVPGQAAGRR